MVTVYFLFYFELLDFSAVRKTLLCFCYISRDTLALSCRAGKHEYNFFLGRKEGEGWCRESCWSREARVWI